MLPGALAGNPTWKLTRNVGTIIASISGTSFYDATLNQANFTEATLKGTDFRKAKMNQTGWINSKKLDLARVGGTILEVPEVQKLLVTGQSHHQNYSGKDLKGANLAKADLVGADFTEADISNATLVGANLANSNLTKTQALGTNFSQAEITGASLESWNIDSTTQLEGVFCEFVYLKKNNCERRPSSGIFAPGEFTKFFQKVLNTIDLIFRDGLDWQAFVTAFNKLQDENENAELTIQGIEDKRDGVVVMRVNAPPETNKEKIHSEFTRNYEVALRVLEAKYQAELSKKDMEIILLHREKSADMKEITSLLAQRSIKVENNAILEKIVNKSQDQSRNFHNVNIEAKNSVVTLGDISGIVTNTLHQLRSSSQPNANELSDRLKNLQAAIETESELNDDDKAEALEQVNVLAQAGQNLQDNTLKKTANTALKILKGTIAALTPTAAIAKACADLFPALTRLLGL